MVEHLPLRHVLYLQRSRVEKLVVQIFNGMRGAGQSFALAASELDPHVALRFLVNKNLVNKTPFRAHGINLLFDFEVK